MKVADIAQEIYFDLNSPSDLSIAAISFWVMPSNTVLGQFKAIATTSEQFWAVLIYQDNSLVHVGRVLADQMTFQREAIEAKPVISLGAVDGLELLSGYKVDSSWFTDGKITIAQLFRRCLDELALKDYWVVAGTETDYFRDAVAPFSLDATSLLAKSPPVPLYAAAASVEMKLCRPAAVAAERVASSAFTIAIPVVIDRLNESRWS